MPEAEQVDPEGGARTPPHTGVLAEFGQLAAAVKELFGAQLELLSAEIGLARSAISWMLLAGLAATIAGVGLGLTLLALVGVLLAKWFASWVWALLALAVLQLVFLLVAIVFFRRCMHWMTLPATRTEWSAMMRETRARARRRVEREDAA
ncbi:MAG TPA: ABC transporter ATP-binding protein [Frateuria sp.]|uniref:ABC transporter ATP-binding protein n=1 Tax=Frateuria sp. TaxID=2211372 RepID=UPI002DF2F054|nr:ABC transporter ATP-binding protein [Frateuria sp.]